GSGFGDAYVLTGYVPASLAFSSVRRRFFDDFFTDTSSSVGGAIADADGRFTLRTRLESLNWLTVITADRKVHHVRVDRLTFGEHERAITVAPDSGDVSVRVFLYTTEGEPVYGLNIGLAPIRGEGKGFEFPGADELNPWWITDENGECLIQGVREGAYMFVAVNHEIKRDSEKKT